MAPERLEIRFSNDGNKDAPNTSLTFSVTSLLPYDSDELIGPYGTAFTENSRQSSNLRTLLVDNDESLASFATACCI